MTADLVSVANYRHELWQFFPWSRKGPSPFWFSPYIIYWTTNRSVLEALKSQLGFMKPCFQYGKKKALPRIKSPKVHSFLSLWKVCSLQHLDQVFSQISVSSLFQYMTFKMRRFYSNLISIISFLNKTQDTRPTPSEVS